MSSSLTTRKILVGLFCLLINISAPDAEVINSGADTNIQVTSAEKIKARTAAEDILKHFDEATQNPLILS